jgi:CheY-like chemotaxis protein
MADDIAMGATPSVLHDAAIAGGMRGLLDAGLSRVVSGETTLQEIDRVIGMVDADHSHAERDASTTVAPTLESPAADVSQATDRSAAPTILVVEDDVVQRRLARAILEKGGFSVVDAINGREALTVFARRRDISLVVTDLQMSELDGEGLLRTIRADIDPNLPVIVLTASNAEERETALLDAGADDYIRKPIDAQRFLARIKACLRRRE